MADIGLAAALAWKLSTLRTYFAETKRSVSFGTRRSTRAHTSAVCSAGSRSWPSRRAPRRRRCSCSSSSRSPSRSTIPVRTLSPLPPVSRLNRHAVAVAGEICLGRAYANTLLLNLQLRKHTAPVASRSRFLSGASKQLSLSGIREFLPLCGEHPVRACADASADISRTVQKHADLDTESGTHDMQTIVSVVASFQRPPC
jgi:hypothetical protein